MGKGKKTLLYSLILNQIGSPTLTLPGAPLPVEWPSYFGPNLVTDARFLFIIKVTKIWWSLIWDWLVLILNFLDTKRENYLSTSVFKGQMASLVTIYVPGELWQPQFSSSAWLHFNHSKSPFIFIVSTFKPSGVDFINIFSHHYYGIWCNCIK